MWVQMDSVYAVTTLSYVFFLAFNVANTDQICGMTIRTNYSNTSTQNSLAFDFCRSA